jgi:hypothetical protein
MLLSFAAFGQSLSDTPRVGTWIEGDLHRYPGAVRLRALLGSHTVQPSPPALGAGPAPEPGAGVGCASIGEITGAVGAALAAEPWLEHCPFTVRASLRRAGDRWLLGDEGGALALAPVAADDLAVLLAATASRPQLVVAEWTPQGVVPVAIHTDDGSIDCGPRAHLTPRWSPRGAARTAR